MGQRTAQKRQQQWITQQGHDGPWVGVNRIAPLGGWTSSASAVQNAQLSADQNNTSAKSVSSRSGACSSEPPVGDRWMWGQNLTELFERGGPVMWPLLACSVLAVALIVERVMVYWSLNVAYRPLLEDLESRVGDGSLDVLVGSLQNSPRPLHRVVVAYLGHRSAEKLFRDQVVLREASQQVARYDRRLNWLGILTHATPLLGLLGTVAGLVDAFHQIEIKGGQVQPGDLASGIWSALLTTVCGLTIALPCLAAYHLLQSVAGKAALQMQWMTSQLDEWLAGAEVRQPAPAAASNVTPDPQSAT